MFEFLFYAALYLTVTTLIGHGIWVGVTLAIRTLRGGIASQHPRGAAAPNLKDDLIAYRRVQHYFRFQGWLQPEENQRLAELADRAADAASAESRPAPSTLPPVAARREPSGRLGDEIGTHPGVEGLRPFATSPPLAARREPSGRPGDEIGTHPGVEGLRPFATSLPVAARREPSGRPGDEIGTHPGVEGLRPFATSPPVAARRAMSEVLQSFLAAHNIRWGELAAGILIIVCSIGLVISLWSTLAETNRLLPAAVFLVAVAAIEGAGLYTLKRWKLRHTSRAVLIIATMLIPLSMMAGISVAGSGRAAVSLTDPWTWGAILTGWLACAVLVALAGAALVRRPTVGLWTLGILVPTILLPVVPGLSRHFGDAAVWALIPATIAVALSVTMDAAGQARGGVRRKLLPARLKRMILLDGMALFSLGVLVAMLVVRMGGGSEVLVPIAVAAIPALLAIAGSAATVRRGANAAGIQVLVTAAILMTIGATFALMPTTLARFEWAALWCVAVAGSGLLVGGILRHPALMSIAPVALALFAPLGAQYMVDGGVWDPQMRLWRRYISAESTLAIAAVAAATLSAAFTVWIIDRRRTATSSSARGPAFPLICAASGILAASVATGAAVGIGPETLLGEVPRGVIVAYLGLAAVVIGVGGRALFDRRVLHAWTHGISVTVTLAAWGAALVPMHIWYGQAVAEWLPRLAMTILGAACMSAGIGEVVAMLAVRREGPTGLLAELRRWWHTTAVYGCVAVVLGPCIYPTDPALALSVAGVGAALVLIAAVRAVLPNWVVVGQGAVAVVLVMIGLWWSPNWLLTWQTWRSTQAVFWLVAVTATIGTLWGWVRLSAPFVSSRLHRVLMADPFQADQWLAAGCVVALTVTVWGNLIRAMHAYAEGTAAALPSGWAVMLAGVATGAALLTFGWRLVVAERRGGAVVSRYARAEWKDWPVAACLILISLLSFWPLYFWGTGARGIVAVGWLCWTATLVGAGISWWMEPGKGRRSILHTRRVWEQNLAMLSVTLLVIVGSAAVALVAGPSGLRLAEPVEGQWVTWTVGLWASGGIVFLAAVSRLLHDRYGGALPAGLIPITAVLVTKLALPEVSVWTLLAVGSSASMVLEIGRDFVVERSGVGARLDAWAPHRATPRLRWNPMGMFAAAGACVATIGAGIATAAVVLNWVPWSSPAVGLWMVAYILAVALAVSHPFMSSRWRWPFATWSVALGSGLVASTLAAWEVFPYVLPWEILAAVWVILALALGIGGLIRCSRWAVVEASVLTPAIILLAMGHFDGALPATILWSVSTLLATGLGLGMYHRLQWPVPGQWMAIAAAASVVILLQHLLPNDNLALAADALVIAGIAAAWRLGWAAAPRKAEQDLSLASRQGARLWVDRVLGLAVLVLVIPVAWGAMRNGFEGWPAESTWAAGLSVLALAGLVAAVLMRVLPTGAIGSAYAASQWIVVIIVGLVVRQSWDVAPLAVAVSSATVLAGLWVWAWPLRRQMLGTAISDPEVAGLDRRAGHELLAMLMITTVVEATVAWTVTVAGLEATSRWLIVAAVAGMGGTLGMASSWGLVAAGLRMSSVCTFMFAMVLTAIGLERNAEPWGLIVSMRLLVAGVFCTPVALWVAPKVFGLRRDQWDKPLRVAAGMSVFIACCAVTAMFVLEFQLRGTETVASVPTSLIVGIALCLGAASAVSATIGLLPSTAASILGPVTDRQRQIALWVAQALGGLAWLHVYLCRPSIALVGLRPYWPYLVMGLAFASAAITEWGRRRGDAVVGRTMRYSTYYLPLIPVIGFWLSADRHDWMLAESQVPYAALLIIAAMFYGGLAILWRRDRVPRIAGIVLANVALWVVLAQTPDFAFARHPQLWLIPPAVCVLIAAHVERNRAAGTVITAIRYAATLVIYVSSTADVLLGEVGATIMGPIVLITLSLMGMLLGVMLRVRPFLYLGTFFVLLGVLSMVWYAQRTIDQSWPWWVFGITTGVLILCGLMAMEKHKGAIRRYANQLAAWE